MSLKPAVAPVHRALPHSVPGSVLVRLKDSVGVDAEAWFHSGKPFRQATADKSASLDLLLQRLDVRGVHAVFRRDLKSVGGDELSHIYRFDLGPGVDSAAAARDLAADPHVVFAEPNGLAVMQALPNDSFADASGSGSWLHSRPVYGYADLWNLERMGWGQVWAQRAAIWPNPARRGGGGVVVAVIDSGLDAGHEDLQGNIWTDAQGHPGRDFVDIDTAAFASYGLFPIDGEDYTTPDGDPADHSGHGTHVAGTIAAVADNQMGIAGVAWKAKVMPIRAGFLMKDRVGQRVGLLSVDAVAAGIQYAVLEGAKVINMSFGGSGQEPQTEAAAIRYARSHGVLLVAAAGNDNSDAGGVYPASNPNVLAVGATLPNDRRVGFSNWGKTVALVAPGTDILSLRAAGTDLGGGFGEEGPDYLRLSGTSMAAPQVSGALALILSAFPGITRDQAVQRLLSTADPVRETVSRDGVLFVQGSGRVNLLRALRDPVRPALALRSLQVTNARHDGALRPGDHASLRIELKNISESAHTVTVDLQATGAAVTGLWVFQDWPTGTARALTATLDIPASRSWESGDLRLAIHGDGFDQTLALPLTVQGPAPKAGWPAKGQDVGEGLITSPALGDLDGDGKLDAVYQSINGTVYARRSGGGLLPGWPVTLPGALEQASPLMIDLNGDGATEVLVAVGEKIHVLDAHGRELPGWPQAVPNLATASLAVGDVTGDGKPDVVAMSDHALVYVFSAAGTLQPGWPQAVGYSGNTTPLLVDLDQDGSALEIVAGTTEGRLVALRGDGTPVGGLWPVRFRAFGPASPAAGDLDGHGRIDIVATDALGPLTRLDSQGHVLWQSPVPGIATFSSPALGDLDGDGRLDVVLGSFDASSEGFVTAYDADGRVLPGWPVYTAGNVAASPALVDIDGDGRPEVLIADDAGLFYAFHGDGRLVAGWPYDLNGMVITSPVVADLDGDGVLEAFAGRLKLGLNTTPVKMIYALECGPATVRAPWPTFKNNPRRTGAAPK